MSTTLHTREVRHPFRGSFVNALESGAGGSAVGYLPGLLGNVRSSPFLDALSRDLDARICAPSLPGFSGSPQCADLRTVFDWVVATSEVVDLVGLTGAPVVASSIGAMLALEVAAVRPEAFERLILIAPLGLWDDADPVRDNVGETFSRQREMLTADPARTAVFFEDDPTMPADEAVEAGVARYLTRATAASLVWPIPDHGLDTRIHRVTCPVTLIWGARDEVVPVSYLDRFAEQLPNVVSTVVIDGAGHLAEWDEPEQVAGVVRDALRS